ncbi:MAG: helix-turn-helix transcriptional regulator [Flavobacteriales bacterium]|nr:helix-turn-helix transcriptional regulator [Flavobacteriales bacterium]
MSQREVADLLNIAPHTYGSWENGKTDIKGDYIPKLAEIFDVDIKELYENDKKIKIGNIQKTKNNATNNGFVIILTNPDDVNKISEIIKNAFK